MTRDEIMALSDERLTLKAQGLLGRKEGVVYSHPALDIRDAWWLFDEVYNKKSPLYGGAWVLGTVNDGKDCSQATLFLHLPWRARWNKFIDTGNAAKVGKYQATEKRGRMARTITLVYVMAMEDMREAG